jgi:hypothetical protein
MQAHITHPPTQLIHTSPPHTHHNSTRALPRATRGRQIPAAARACLTPPAAGNIPNSRPPILTMSPCQPERV